MNIAIFYYSKTGNTKKLAEIAFDLLKKNHKVELKRIGKTDKNLSQYDIIILGSYCDSNSYPKKVKEFFLEIKGKIKKMASFVTHATESSGPYYEKWAKGCEDYFNNYCKENNIENIGYFHCQAKPSLPISIFIKNVVCKEKKDWENYKKDMKNHPDKSEIDSFINFLKSVEGKIK